MSKLAEAGKAKILIVEDNDFVRTQIVRFLGGEGHTVIEAPDGRMALDIVGIDKSIDLVICDVRMEPIDGFEFVRTAQGLGLSMPVILVTGDQNPDLLNEANKWGVAAVLMKPVQKDRLVKTVQRVLYSRARA